MKSAENARFAAEKENLKYTIGLIKPWAGKKCRIWLRFAKSAMKKLKQKKKKQEKKKFYTGLQPENLPFINKISNVKLKYFKIQDYAIIGN